MATCVQHSKHNNQRKILGMSNSNKPPVLKGSSPVDLADLLDKMKLQLESKIEALHGDGTTEKNKLKDVFAAAMVKIPRNVKSMRVAEFNALYRSDILSVIEHLPTAGKKRDRLETPSQQTTTGGRLPLATPSRTVRKGEMLFSKNGTPIEGPNESEIILTVTKAKKRRTGSTSDAGASLDINLGGGQFLSLQDPTNLDALEGHEKTMAFQQLQMLKDQVDLCLKNLTENK